MIDVLYYRDGGTTGFEAEVDGKRTLFCLDGRMRIRVDPSSDIKLVYHVFLNATHPEHPNGNQRGQSLTDPHKFTHPN